MKPYPKHEPRRINRGWVKHNGSIIADRIHCAHNPPRGCIGEILFHTEMQSNRPFPVTVWTIVGRGAAKDFEPTTGRTRRAAHNAFIDKLPTD